MISVILTITIIAGIYGIMTVALNLQYGTGGLINFGIVAYFAAGSYAYVIVTNRPPLPLDNYLFGFGLPMWVGFIAAGVAAVLLAAITAGPTLRLRGEYLALVTFAFAEVLHSVFVNELRISNGTVGFSGIDRPFRGLVSGAVYPYVFATMVLLVLAVTYVVGQRIVKSPFGRTLRAIRDDEVAAELAEKPVAKLRLQIFVFSALMTGFAGALYAWYTTVVNPGLFTAEVTFVVWIALILGGAGSNRGAIVGAFVLVAFEEALRFISFTPDVAARVSAIRGALVGLLLVLLLRYRGDGRKRSTSPPDTPEGERAAVPVGTSSGGDQ
jgi:branched-chain amino acid transport system permease protein